MKIKNQFIILALLIVVAGVLFLMLYLEVKNETIKQANNEQIVYAKQASNSVSAYFDDIHFSLNFLVKDENIIEFDEKGAQKIKDFYLGNSNLLNAVTLTDSTGKMVYTYPYNKSAIGKDISYQEHVKNLLTGKKPVLSQVFYALQGYNAIAYYVPVINNGKFLGGIGTLIKFDDFTKKYLQDIRIKENGFAWIINQTGTILYHPDEDLIEKQADSIFQFDKSFLQLISFAKSGNSGAARHKLALNGKETTMQSAYFPVSIADNNWTIIVSTPQDEILKTMQGFLLKWFILAMLMLFGILIFTYFSIKARSIIKEEVRRKKAEAELIASEKKFRKLVEISPNGILLLDLKGKIQACNNRTLQILKVTDPKLVEGNYISDYFSENDKQAVKENISKIISNSEEIHTYEYEIKSNGHISSPVEFSGAVIENFDGTPIGISAILKDITERKKVESALRLAKRNAERSDKLKSEFLAQMSHEIRSPINSILSFTSLIKDEVKDQLSGDLTTSFSIIENAGKRIIRTIDLILNMSEIQTGTFQAHLKDVFIFKDVLNKIYPEFKHVANENGLEFYLKNHTGKSDICVYGDEYTIGQIFNNLVNNAVKYTESGKVEIIVSYNEDADLVISICDTGIGISKEYLPNIFKPFTQEEQGYTRKFEGNGLGLALVKKYCEINKIDINVESEKGTGSVFNVILKKDLILY